MSTDTNISTLVLNKLTKEQYANIASPNNQELYFITNEDTFIASDQGSNNAGKILTVGNDGIVIPGNAPSGLPDQTGNDGKYLTTNGTNASWVNLSNVASTGNYNDLVNTPTIPAAQVNSDWNATSGVAEILNKPTLSNVALSGEYSDLLNTPNLANVATTGEYSDLLNTPSIPSPQVNSDWNSTSGVSEILNKPTLSTVATTGDYNDLINKPTIPSNFANVAFTGDYSDLTNTPVLGTAAYANTSDFATAAEGNLATSAVQPGDLASVATTGEYSDLLNTPTIPAAQVNADWNAVSGVAQILNKPTLANIATTGEYSDLVNAPTLSNVAKSGDYNDLTNKPTIPTVSDATIIITQGGVQKGSFTLNQASGDTIALDAGGGSSLPSQTGHSGEFLTTDGTDASWASLANIATTGEYSDLVNAPTIPVVVQDFYVDSTTGAINCVFSSTPNNKTVHTIIGNSTIVGTWSGNVFTPTNADDILNNANGFVVSVN